MLPHHLGKTWVHKYMAGLHHKTTTLLRDMDLLKDMGPLKGMDLLKGMAPLKDMDPLKGTGPLQEITVVILDMDLLRLNPKR